MVVDMESQLREVKLTATALQTSRKCGHYDFGEAERSFKCSVNGMKSLSENKRGRLFSIQNDAIMTSAVFLMVMPFFLSLR